jgi:hypothetical protein
VERLPEQNRRRSRWQPPPDSDLIGIPLIVGLGVAILAILAAFIFIGWFGLIVLGAVLIAGLAISFRVITASESEDQR